MSESERLGWEVLASEEVGDYEVFRVCKRTARANATGKAHDFHIVEREPCVQVVASLVDGRIVMVKQFRQGVQRISVEFPAGSLDSGEDAVAGALRELEEETGYTAGHAEKIATINTDTALIDDAITVVAAYDCRPSGERNLDETEVIETLLFTPAQVDDLIRSGEITLAAAIAAWHLFKSCEG
jgi:ADP-ribose pyrophosphatase